MTCIMSKKILFILILGVIYKLIMTSNGNFIFHSDSARDMVEVREMVVLGKARFTGPTTAISGLFNGPAWYYLLSIPFVMSNGDPYAPLLMQIILWVIGGFFLLKIVSKWGSWLVFPIGFLWIASDYIGLTTEYAFNPNPVILLTPLFIYIFSKYLENTKTIFAILTAILAGLFFNFEMSFGIFLPIIIFSSLVFSKKTFLFKNIKFWISILFFILFLVPQLIFNIRYHSLMLNALIAHMHRESGKIPLDKRLSSITSSFYNLFIPTILNRKLLSSLLLIFSIPAFLKFFKDKKKDTIVIITLCYVFIPFAGYLLLPITINPWHLGGPMTGSIILVGFVLKKLMSINLPGKLISLVLTISILFFSLANMFKFFTYDINIPSMDPSLLKNELSAIDYVYQYANGKNFKVYSYLPSVYDYPYQYLFWWYGLRKYGYLPIDYAYAPNVFDYIPSKTKFSADENQKKLRKNSNMVFLIKEPDRDFTRSGWEGNFIKYKSIDGKKVGPIDIEIREDLKNSN